MGRSERDNPFRQWQKAEGVSTTQSYDRFGRPLQTGDAVHLMGKLDVMWRVLHVKPILDPKVPPGTVELALQAEFVTGVPGGQPVMDVIKVKDASEFPQPAEAQGDGDPGESGEEPGGGVVQ